MFLLGQTEELGVALHELKVFFTSDMVYLVAVDEERAVGVAGSGSYIVVIVFVLN